MARTKLTEMRRSSTTRVYESCFKVVSIHLEALAFESLQVEMFWLEFYLIIFFQKETHSTCLLQTEEPVRQAFVKNTRVQPQYDHDVLKPMYG